MLSKACAQLDGDESDSDGESGSPDVVDFVDGVPCGLSSNFSTRSLDHAAGVGFSSSVATVTELSAPSSMPHLSPPTTAVLDNPPKPLHSTIAMKRKGSWDVAGGRSSGNLLQLRRFVRCD